MSYLSKVASFDLLHIHLSPSLGVTQFVFRGDFWHQKTKNPWAIVSHDTLLILGATFISQERLKQENFQILHTGRLYQVLQNRLKISPNRAWLLSRDPFKFLVSPKNISISTEWLKLETSNFLHQFDM